MQDQHVDRRKSPTERQHRNQKFFELTQSALTGLLAGNSSMSDQEMEEAAAKAVKAARFTIQLLIKERVL